MFRRPSRVVFTLRLDVSNENHAAPGVDRGRKLVFEELAEQPLGHGRWRRCRHVGQDQPARQPEEGGDYLVNFSRSRDHTLLDLLAPLVGSALGAGGSSATIDSSMLSSGASSMRASMHSLTSCASF